MPVRISYKQRNFDSLIQKIIQKKTRKFKSVDSKVSKIIEDVIRNGDNSLIRLTKKYDNFKLSSKNIRFSKSEIKNSIKKCNVEQFLL